MLRFNKTLVALVGAVVLPLGLLLMLANLPGGGRGSLGAILFQVVIILVSVVLFAVFLARFMEQFNARRVRRWLGSEEGQAWLADLPEVERTDFLARLDGEVPADEPPAGGFPVDSSDPSR